jgi:outer membrane protein OmpA-like peptidoglycan-associated protein
MNRSLILGLLALVILCVLCLWCRAPAIEDDLRGKALLCVEDAGVDAGVLAVSGRDVTLEGTVASLSVGDAIEACIAAIPGIRVVNNNLQTVAVVEQPKAPEPAEPAIVDAPEVNLGDLLAGKVVEFATNTSDLTARARSVLDEVAAIMKANPGRVEIAGYADSRQTQEYNLWLSERRAESVQRYLVATGIDAGRFEVVEYGEKNPVDSNATAEGQQNNRRTEFHALKEN